MRFIGCKTLLLDQIKDIIEEKAPEAESVCDIFSGTATVSRYLKKWYKIYSNDLLYFSYVLQRGTVENNIIPAFDKLNKGIGIGDPISYFNNLSTFDMEDLEEGKRFFQNTYSPKGGRMYVNDDNALRIDFVRNKIEEWKTLELLTVEEYFYLLACVVEGIPFVSNISGTYGAFHKTWDKRSYKKYELYRLDVIGNGKENKAFNEDGVKLASNIKGDLIYIDPPYNSRQYLPNYHVLETAALYDFPEIRGVTGQRPYENKKSLFCTKKTVIDAFASLIENAQFKHIVMSYSTDGLMELNDIKEVMTSYGISSTFDVRQIPYRRYKSRKLNEKDDLKELLIYIKKEV